jgi:UDP-N-acetylmuramoyl-tripeptide--D-alanyl-D-alanine ligase
MNAASAVKPLGMPHTLSAATMSIADCARLLGARVHPHDNASNANIHALFHGVSSDSRAIVTGELFVALKGENFDGHQYVNQAAERGALAALVSRVVDVPITQIVVGDVMFAYGQLAQRWRNRFTLPTIAITGSNGKTTVKEMLRSILIAHTGDDEEVLATEGNLNNNIGVPQMMLRLNAAHRYAVFEMGMNHLDEIDYLTRLVTPDVALVIMAGTAHIGELGSREAIAQAKGEIYAGLRQDGVACINLDDRFADYWKTLVGARRTITFGTHANATLRGELTNDVANDGVMLCANGERAMAKLHVAGEHNQRNAIAAAAGAFALGVPLATIARGLALFRGVAGRLKACAGINDAAVIDDTYNANPDSMRAAIAVLAKHSGSRILVLGDMAELGDDAAAMHAEIGRDARNANIDAVFAVGALSKNYVEAFGAGAQHFDSVDALVAHLLSRMNSDTTVLVKGSRSSRMERVVEKITIHYNKGAH